MQPPTSLGQLGDDDWRELNERADRFACIVAKAPDTDWEQFLTGLGGNMRLAVIVEFIKIDMAESWKQGRKQVLKDYLSRFREFDNPKRIPVHLITEEIRIRRLNGDNFDTEEYLRQFPEHASLILDQLPASGTVAQTMFPAEKEVKLSAPKFPDGTTELTNTGNYLMQQELGRGQFGKVYKAIAPGGVDVAIKVIPRAADGNEALKERGALQLVKNLRHPHLLPVLAYWEHDDNLYIVMELADGTLGDRLRTVVPGKKTPIPKPTLLKFITEVAGALDFLHSKKLLHRDIKPANILLVGDFAKIGDFGLARPQSPKGHTGTFAGTPAFMPPEAWASRPGPASDQYSLALTYVELRIGKRLIDGDDYIAVMSQHLELLPEIPGLPAKEQAAIRKALAREPEDRFATCMDFARALTDETPPPSKMWMVYAGIVVAGIATAGYFAWPPKRIDIPVTSPPTNPGKTDVEPKKEPTPEPTWRIPAGFSATPGTAKIRIGETDYAKQIQRVFEEAGVVRFVLIEPSAGTAKPFYAQEHKVSNALVVRYAKANPGALAGSRWNAGADLAPAMNLRMSEAIKIAEWLGGRLPTPEEWDTLAGFRAPNRDASITLKGKPAIGLAIPRSLVDNDTDRGFEDICDLAGNGREFTSVILQPDGSQRPLMKVEDDQALVVLRGRMHTLAKPLTWTLLESEQKTPQTQFFGKSSLFTGFRVVVDVNKP